MYSSHRGAPGGTKSATACITSLHIAGKNSLVDFNLAVPTQTAKFNSPSIFRLYGTHACVQCSPASVGLA